MRLPIAIVLAVGTLLIAGFSGCRQEGSAEKFGRKVDDATARATDAIDSATERAGDSIDRATERASDAIDSAAERASDAIDKAAETAKKKLNGH